MKNDHSHWWLIDWDDDDDSLWPEWLSTTGYVLLIGWFTFLLVVRLARLWGVLTHG